jgi:hypothetical protein
MLRLFIVVFVGFALLVCACSKNNDGEESALYGTWVKGSQTGDTLWFMRKDGKNIMRSNQSFNPGLPNQQEMEYRFMNGKLSVAVYGPAAALRPIDSFTWQQPGKRFDILGFQLFIFMSSSVTHFTYTKIN